MRWAKLLLVCALVAVLCTKASFDAEKQSEPPHAAPAVARVDRTSEVVAGLVDGVVGREIDGILAALELERMAREAEELAASRARAVAVAVAPRSVPSCDGVEWVVPVRIVISESGCRFDAVNATGCGGYSCLGAYQFDARHWDVASWGGCADLGDWRDPEAQHECARRLSNGGTNLRPWGG